MKNYPIKFAEVIIAKGKNYCSLDAKPYKVDISLTGQMDPFGVTEVQIYIEQLIRKNGPPPKGLRFFVLQVNSQWRIYFKAAVQFNRATHEIDKYITKLDKGVAKWDEVSLKALQEIGHPFYTKNKLK